MKISDPGRSRSGHQFNSNDLTSEKMNAGHSYTDWMVALKLSDIDMSNIIYIMYIVYLEIFISVA